MDLRRGPDPDDDEITAQHLQALHEAVLTFREFLAELTPCRRADLAATLPWVDEGSEIWIDFEAWVQVTLEHLRGPEQQHDPAQQGHLK